MKKLLLAIFMSSVLLNNIEAAVIDKVVAVVNGEVITEGEVSRLLDPLYLQYKQILPPEELEKRTNELREKIINDLIDDKLLLSEAKKLGITAPETEVEKKVEGLKKTFSKREDFDNALLYQNLTVTDLKDRFKTEIIKGKLIDYKIKSYIDVTPIKVNEYYNKHQDEFNEPESVKLRIIYVKKDGNRDAKKTIENALKLIRVGADFSEMAKKYSESSNSASGGDMGKVTKGRYKENIDKIIFALKDNEVSEVVETESGYYIFKVYERTQPRVRLFSDVKDEIRNKLYMEEAQKKLKDYLGSLRENAYISIK